jgi:type IX secretion system substrate protein
MKNLLTLFLTALTSLSFAQQAITTMPKQPKQYKMLPGSARPNLVHRGSNNARSLDSCNTEDYLDYNTYNELVANNLQITYNGSWNSATPMPYGNEINSSFITVNSADAGIYSYAIAAFDSLAFANFSAQTMYSKQLSASVVTLDTLGMFIGVAADDTTSTGGLAGDSLKFSIFPITAGTISNTAAQVLTYSGYDALQPFVVGNTPGYLKYAQVPVGQAFAPGQGFAVRVDFFSSDTSSHCILSFSYADSCGTVVFQGNTYASPAYPTPFINSAKYSNQRYGNTYYGEIDSTGPTTAAVTDVSDGAYYINIPGIPADCQKLYVENWELIPLVSVQSAISILITDSNYTIPCAAGNHAIIPTKGGDLANATYAWSSNVSGSQTTANTTIANPGTYTVTVTNSQGCTATAQVVAVSASGANITPSFTIPDSICIHSAAGFTNTSNEPGYTATWTYGQGLDSITPVASSVYIYTATGNYPVTLILDSAGCSFSTTQTVTVNSTCFGVGIQNIAFENSVSLVPNPSSGNLSLTINGAENNVTITIYNILGETVKAFATSESPAVFNKTLDLNNLSNGTYLVRIQSGSKMATKKLVITK